MEGVGARLGRSSTRYGPATVFSGPVRKWKKKWVHVSPSNASNNHSQTAATNGTNGSHLLLFKWTPIAQSNNNNGDKIDGREENIASATPEEPPRRKFKYVPVAVLEEQTKETADNVEDEAKPSTIDPTVTVPSSKSNGFDEKPDINDVPMEEAQDEDRNHLGRQDLNETTLDLSLGLKAHDGENDSNSRMDHANDGRLERLSHP